MQTHQSSRRTERSHLVDDEEDLKGHPFTKEIMEEQLPSKWKGLTIRLYDGSTESDEHLNVSKTQMNLHTTNKVVWCKVFPTSLQEGTPVVSPDSHQIRWIVSKPRRLNLPLNMRRSDHIICHR